MKHIIINHLVKNISLTLLIVLVCGANLVAQFGEQPEVKVEPLPPVFKIGDYEKEYEELVTSCNTMLLTVCENSMEKAYGSWTTMLSNMESYADELDFDLKGIKIWINVFWSADGEINHIVYYPKPNSKNMNFDELTAFLKLFMENYNIDQTSSRCYSHYGSASFPTFATLYNTNAK